MEAPYGEVVEAGPGVRRVLARNPSPFTSTGTQTHIVGTGEVAVVDPGPDLPEHVDAILAEAAAQKGQELNYKTSIVDLMKLLDLDPSLGNRKELAEELGYTGEKDGSAEMNIWLHKQVMDKLAENGGKVPAELRN